MNRPIPVSVQYGQGPRQVVVLSPVLSAWDEGKFFAPLTRVLTAAGYCVVIYDTLSLLPDKPMAFRQFVGHWSAILERLGPIELLAGCALGGSVVQALLNDTWAAALPRVLLLSAPTHADQTLNLRLGGIVDHARASRLGAALTLLEGLVLPEPAQSPLKFGNRHVAGNGSNTSADEAQRLARGFELLLDVDVRPSVLAFEGRLLHIYGRRSQLVRGNNVLVRGIPQHRCVAIPDGGMRPLFDDPERVCAEVREHLGINLRGTHGRD
ncbi:alpha/beta fold hydrolase [Paraherbaspirillum soli]|uniref:Alpha/beta fold hydrolase n=1 Tax=Paraherbaspirillum soli TaxID=631222 RepID=A0ABW0MFE0_9BURK